MRKTMKRVICSSAALVLGITFDAVLHAQHNAPVQPGPVPAQISSAKKVFISNAGGQCNLFGNPTFSGSPDRTYDELYAAMKSWGRYELTSAPADADLVFEINLTCELFPDAKRSATDAQFRLLILDPKTHILLWGFTQQLPVALLLSNRDKNFDEAMASLMERLKRLPGQTAAADRAAK